LNIERLYAAQMDGLGGVTAEMLTAQIEILADNEVLDSGEDTVDANSEEDVYLSGRGTHNPAVPDIKSGAIVVYIGQGGDNMRL
jgi:hypothetical protein